MAADNVDLPFYGRQQEDFPILSRSVNDMDESEHGGDKRFCHKDERLAARCLCMAAVVFDELYCMVGALGFVGIIAAAVDDIPASLRYTVATFLLTTTCPFSMAALYSKYRVVGRWIADQSASRPATKLSTDRPHQWWAAVR